MSNPFGPVDPDQYTGLLDGAKTMYMMFRSYVDAGFTEDQAMKLVIALMTAGLKNKIGATG